MVWSAGARSERRRPLCPVRDRAFLPGSPGFWDSDWVTVPSSIICADDIALWPYTPGLLVKWVTFLGTLHWPAGGVDLGVGGISFVELLILYELWAGERLSLEKAQPRYLRLARPISVSAVPFGPGIDIWCSFEVSLLPAWGDLLGLFLAPSVLIIVGFVLLGGRSVVMVLLLVLVKAPLCLSWMNFSFFFVILLGLGVLCLLALFPFVTALIVLLVGPQLGGCMLLVVLETELSPESVDISVATETGAHSCSCAWSAF